MTDETMILHGIGTIISKGHVLGSVEYSAMVPPNSYGGVTLDGDPSILRQAFEERDTQLKLEEGQVAKIIVTALEGFPRVHAVCTITSRFR